MCLTERVGRGIALTPAAEILVAHTDALLGQLDAAEAEVAALRDQVAGNVTLAAFPSAAARIVPIAWAALARSSPHLHLGVHDMEPDESVPAVLRGEIDVAVAHEYDVVPRPLDPLLERRDLLAEPVFLAVPADSLAARAPSVELGSVATEPFLAPTAGTTCAEMVQRACALAGFVPRVVARATDFQVLLNFVAAGAGVMLIPHLAAYHVPPESVSCVRRGRSRGRSSR
jgi:DNA-binding transcriptional LysR family regulator